MGASLLGEGRLSTEKVGVYNCPTELQNPDDVHFKAPGYELMGQQVATSVMKSLGK